MNTIQIHVDWEKLNNLVGEAATADYNATHDSLSGWGGGGKYAHRPLTAYGLMSAYAQCMTRIHVAWKLIHAGKNMGNEENVRARLRFALAIGKLHTYLHEIAPPPFDNSVICCVTNGKLNVQGLAWYFGEKSDWGHPPIQAVEDFVNGGSIAVLKEAVIATNKPNAGDVYNVD